jgi:molybdopterin-guanine dinucleotide biosynthesis protein A
MQIHSAILAGGKNSRYNGMNKAFILIDGERIINRNINVLSSLFSQISIITNQIEQFSDYSDYPMSSDYFKEIGPLAGIHSALKNTTADAVFISSCDMPFLNSDIIKPLIEAANQNKFQAIIPACNERIEPLHAIYHRDLFPILDKYIRNNENRSVRDFLNTIESIYIDFSEAEVGNAFTNINRPSDLDVL